jgi:hypothetical protein
VPDCLCPLGDSLKVCHTAQPSAVPARPQPPRAICGRHAVLWTTTPPRESRIHQAQARWIRDAASQAVSCMRISPVSVAMYAEPSGPR